MTFSIIAMCPDTGSYGAAITTSNLAVGSRCVRLSHGVGAFLSQHRTDPRLGDIGLAHLESGLDAQAAIAAVGASTADIEWRQLAALDKSGTSAVFHGQKMYSIYTHSGAKNCLAIGNILANETVTDRMADAFASSSNEPFGNRLMIALEAGRDAGGEIIGPLRSASIRVTGALGIDACDLRIDRDETDAVAQLRALFDAYQSEGKLLRQVALDPDAIGISKAMFDKSVVRIKELGLEDRFPSERRKDDWSIAAPKA